MLQQNPMHFTETMKHIAVKDFLRLKPFWTGSCGFHVRQDVQSVHLKWIRYDFVKENIFSVEIRNFGINK